MRSNRPSLTAEWVAAFRAVPMTLPADARLIEDPYGTLFGDAWVKWLTNAAVALPFIARPIVARVTPFQRMLLWMQLRTRALDDEVLRFFSDRGRQLVILGAGYDCRAVRFSSALGSGAVFEVDHPATQGRKRERLAAAGVSSSSTRYLTWDFEQRPMHELPAALAALGHDPSQPTLTLWEGVTMYLTEAAIETSLEAIRTWSPPGSRLAMTYQDVAQFSASTPSVRIARRIVAAVGEPHRWGWNPAAFPEWMAKHGYDVVSDRGISEFARELLPARYADVVAGPFGHVAVVAPQ